MKNYLKVTNLVVFLFFAFFFYSCNNKPSRNQESDDNKAEISILLNKNQINIQQGYEDLLIATIVGLDKGEEEPTVNWQSTDNFIVSINENGLISANKEGSATITCSLENGNNATCNINVSKYSVKALRFKSTEQFQIQTKNEPVWDGQVYWTVNPFDEDSWQEWDGNPIESGEIIEHGSKYLHLKGKNNTTISKIPDSNRLSGLSITGNDVYCNGNCCALLDEDNTDTVYPYCFAGLFSDCDSLLSAPELPSLILSKYCYNSMFARSGLINPPALPAKIIEDGCYFYMFLNCKNLVSLSSIAHIEEISDKSCYGMFQGCEKIILHSEDEKTADDKKYIIPISASGENTETEENIGTSYLQMFQSTGGYAGDSYDVIIGEGTPQERIWTRYYVQQGTYYTPNQIIYP